MTFVFQNRRTLTLADIEELDGDHRQQFIQVMYGHCEAARSETTPRGCVEAMVGPSVDDFSIDLWDVVRDGVVVYEYWVQGAGDGQVFAAGTDETTFIHSVQHRFQSSVADAATEELARALARDAPRVL